eukprot:COSAG02_NODE_4927_length_4825_cov_9.987093_6_plen_32_part_01
MADLESGGRDIPARILVENGGSQQVNHTFFRD